MKTLCFTLGLLLLTVCCCNAGPEAVRHSTAPQTCCHEFYEKRLPIKRVTNITKTDKTCLKKAFIVQTVIGKQICYRQTFVWALDVYNQLH
ncbi:C-C motif chemokine 4-like [Limanda limanda]|uniref:C-C motif chemokine 4-like n=1 Tax=Limanda limanda TaxID=27771 RepID=UPI0029C6CDB5|nr:C-C motif chemokine 4-like [Limanda limanda]